MRDVCNGIGCVVVVMLLLLLCCVVAVVIVVSLIRRSHFVGPPHTHLLLQGQISQLDISTPDTDIQLIGVKVADIGALG